MKYYIANKAGEVEEIELSTLKYFVERGFLSFDTLVCTDEDNMWITFREMNARAESKAETPYAQLSEAGRLVTEDNIKDNSEEESELPSPLSSPANSYPFTTFCFVILILSAIALIILFKGNLIDGSSFVWIIGFIPLFVICIILDALICIKDHVMAIRYYIRKISLK